MADQSVPRKNQAYVLRTTLVSQANTNVMQNPPTVAAGDVLVSTDGSALVASTNAPSLIPAGSRIASVTLTLGEMNGDIVIVCWSDAVGAQWQDQTHILHPTPSTLEVIAAAITAATTTITNAITAATTTITTAITGVPADVWSYVAGPGRTLTAFGTLVADIATAVWAYVAGAGRTLTSFGTLVADIATAVWSYIAGAGRTLTSFGTLIADLADAVWDELRAGHVIPGSFGASYIASFPAGAIAFTYTVTDVGTGNPIEGVDVRISTDVAGTNMIWAGTTDAFGVARDINNSLPYLDAGTYYFWCQKTGYTFPAVPDPEVVS